MSLSDYQNGGKQSKINSAKANAAKSASKAGAGKPPISPSDKQGASNIKDTNRGAATQFDSQYKIQEFTYPIDLMSSDYGSNYTVFYINVSNDSKLAKNKEDIYVGDIPERDRGPLIASNYTKAQVVTGTTIAGAAPAAAAGAVVKGDLTGAAAGVGVAAGLGYVGVSAIQSQSTSFTRQQKRLKTAIALHVPNQLSVRYGTNWGEEDTNTFAMGAAGADAIGKFLSEGGKMDQLTGPGKAIAAAIALDKLPGGAALSAMSGIATNPRKEQMFKSVDFRTFQFSYEFYPRDPKEAEYVLNIIHQFKLHMHPEYKDTSQFLYIYPSEFDIYHYQGTGENMNLHRHTSCVLTEMTVNYSPQGQFTTFDNGMPTQINITLNFRELSLLTKDKIQDGF